MARDVVSIYNLALNAAGTRNNISLPTERSREAEVCNLWYEPTRDFILRAAPWSSTKAHARLSVLAERDDNVPWENGDPEPGYRYAYALPADFVAPRYLTDYRPFTLSLLDQSRRAIMTNSHQPILCYSSRQTDPTMWDDQLYMAVAYALAANISMPLTGKMNRTEINEMRANSFIAEARLTLANTDVETYDWTPEWLSARGYTSTRDSHFIYPSGPLFRVMSNVNT